MLAPFFVLQFVALDIFFRGRVEPTLTWLASVTFWSLALVLGTTPARRIPFALLAAFVLVVQVDVFRYYHAPLDAQVAASALYAWSAIRGVVVRAIPIVVVSTLVVAALELAVLSFVMAPFAGARHSVMALAGLFLLLGGSPRAATPDIQCVYALSALRDRHEPVVAGVPYFRRSTCSERYPTCSSFSARAFAPTTTTSRPRRSARGSCRSESTSVSFGRYRVTPHCPSPPF